MSHVFCAPFLQLMKSEAYLTKRLVQSVSCDWWAGNFLPYLFNPVYICIYAHGHLPTNVTFMQEEEKAWKTNVLLSKGREKSIYYWPWRWSIWEIYIVEKGNPSPTSPCMHHHKTLTVSSPLHFLVTLPGGHLYKQLAFVSWFPAPDDRLQGMKLLVMQ